MTKTEIANIALAKFREGRITNIESDTDSVAVVMNDQYDHALELLLEEHRWNFAGTRITLTQLSDAPPFGWKYQYQLPSDIIRLRDVNGEDVEASSQLFALEGNKLLTNDAKVTITYTGKITDVNLFSPSFIEALAFKLASITCGRLTGDAELAVALGRQYEQALAKSMHNDTKANGSRDKNLMQRMMGGSAILGGTYAPYRGVSTSSGSSSTSGSVAAHKHEVTDLLQTGATDGQVLTWNNTTQLWEAADSAGGSASPLTTKGDLYGFDTDNARLGVGTDGQFLKADSTEATGLKWETLAGGGDMLSTNNLSDVTSASTSRTNLGLGTAATSNTGDFASASHTHTASNITDFDTEVSNNTSVVANTAKVTNVTTNLSYTASPTDGTVTSSDGTDATVTLADGTNAGLLAPADFTKLGNQSGTNTGDEAVASLSIAGVAEVATAAEINSGAADITRMVHPFYLANSDYITDSKTATLTNKTFDANGTGNSISNIDPADLSATGTPSSSTYLRGDNTWATVSGGGGGTSVSVSDTAPSSPSAGDLWFDSSTAKMYIYYSDANTDQWVSVTSGLPTPDSKTGWMDYNDSTGSFSIAADTWTNVPNNGAGSFTNKTFKPPSVTEVLDTTTGHLDFSDLPLGSEITLRNDITVVPNSNNALLQMRYVLGTGANEYALNFLNDRLDSGSGVSYQKVNTFPIYMGDTNTKNNAGKLQIKLSVAGTVTNSGVYASIQLY